MKSQNAFGAGGRYHSYLRQIYQIITTDAPQNGQTLALSLAVKVGNGTSGVNGLLTSLLVFDIVPSLPIVSREIPTQIDRMEEIKVAWEEMMRKIVTDRIRLVLSKNVPAAEDEKIMESTEV